MSAGRPVSADVPARYTQNSAPKRYDYDNQGYIREGDQEYLDDGFGYADRRVQTGPSYKQGGRQEQPYQYRSGVPSNVMYDAKE